MAVKHFPNWIRWAAPIGLAILICGIHGCRVAPTGGAGKSAKEKRIVVGFAMDTLKEERWQRDRDFFTERLHKMGAEVIVQHAYNDTAVQLRQIDYLIRRRVDVLVVVPHDASKVAAAINRAKRAGIKVVSYDRLVRNTELDLYVSFDNVKVGELMAGYLVKRVPQGKYVIINGAPTDNNCYMFNEGYKKVLNSPEHQGKIQIVYEAWTEDWRPEEAYRYIEELLRDGKRFDAVIAANDSLASAVIEVLSEWRLAGKVAVVGHDADLSGCQRIVEGTQVMTVYKPIRRLADRAAELVYALARGKTVKTSKRIFNGKHFVPYEMIEPIPIDAANMQLVINDGFHALEDVYLHVPKAKWPRK